MGFLTRRTRGGRYASTERTVQCDGRERRQHARSDQPSRTPPRARRLRSARLAWLESTEPLLWWDRAEPALWCDSSKAADIADPIDPAEANEPTLAKDATEAALPIERTESWE